MNTKDAPMTFYWKGHRAQFTTGRPLRRGSRDVYEIEVLEGPYLGQKKVTVYSPSEAAAFNATQPPLRHA